MGGVNVALRVVMIRTINFETITEKDSYIKYLLVIRCFFHNFMSNIFRDNLTYILYFLYIIASWEYVNGWSTCSATCGGGTQTRTQSCMNSNSTGAEGQCIGNVGSESKDCSIDPCRKFLINA